MAEGVALLPESMIRRLLHPRLQLTAAALAASVYAVALFWCFFAHPLENTPPDVLRVAGKFHPLLLHLPIGFSLAAVVLELTGGPFRRHDSAVLWMLWLTALFGAPAAVAGYFLGASGAYDMKILRWHMWTGLLVPVLAFAALLTKLLQDLKTPMSVRFHRIPLLGTAVAVFVAGHFGGTMTHGDILKDIQKLADRPGASPEASKGGAASDPTFFEAIVAPVMAAKCEGCHGEAKQQGELRLDSYEAMLAAGESGNPSIKPGNSAESESIRRVLLPLEEDEHMPPENKPQLTEAEREALAWWVDAGAPLDLKLSDPSIPATLREKLPALLSAGARGPLGEEGTPAPAPAQAAEAAEADPVAALEKELGASILPLAQNDPGLVFNCVNIADKFDDAALAKFAPIADRLWEMNLARSRVTDAGMPALSAMKNLRRLHLQNTAVTDAAIDSLLGLQELEYLNLFNTKVTDEGIAKLEKLPRLKRLYVWQTGVTRAGAEALHAKLPELVINLGWDQEVKTAVVVAPAPAEPAPAPEEVPLDPEKPVYEGLIQPIFAAKCVGCHGEERQRGKLAMHTFEVLMKNGDSGEPAVVPGKSADSLIVKRIALPTDDDEHMPPANKPQLSEKEFAILKWWIDAGAKTDVKIKDAGLPDDLK